MIADGVLQTPRPDYSLSMHLWNDRPVGEIMVTPGPAMAGAESFSITVTGKGAHGASPHLGHDPVLAAAHIITAVQSIVSRNVKPLETAVVSVTSVHGGTAVNIIPPAVELLGTIRTYLPEVRELVGRRMHEICEGVAVSMGCKAELTIDNITPAVINDPALSERMGGVSKKALPMDELFTNERTMGSEDMAFMMTDIPGCYMFVGSNNSEKNLDYGHHHPKFDFDEQALPRGVALMTAAAMDLLKAE